MSAPKPFTLKSLLPGADVVGFINGSLMPVLRLMWQKFAGMMSDPGEYSVAVWQNGTWRSVRFGTLGAPLGDADTVLTVADGNLRIQPAGSLTAPRTHTVGTAGMGSGDTVGVWNQAEFTLTILGAFDPMTLPPGWFGYLAYTASGGLFVSGRWEMAVNP